jgi:predicted aldo/keto reductase-like oxidoreductase
MYATDYGDPELARAEYAQLGAGAAACSSCSEQRCLGACPGGINIPTLTRFTAETLG